MLIGQKVNNPLIYSPTTYSRGRGIRNLKRGNSFGFKLPAFDARKFRDIAVPELDSRGIVRDVSHT